MQNGEAMDNWMTQSQFWNMAPNDRFARSTAIDTHVTTAHFQRTHAAVIWCHLSKLTSSDFSAHNVAILHSLVAYSVSD